MEKQFFETIHDQYNCFKSDVKAILEGPRCDNDWNSSVTKILLGIMLQSIDGELKQLESGDQHYVRLLGMKWTLLYLHAKVLFWIQDNEAAQSILSQCMEELKDHIVVPQVTFLGLKILNHYCYLLVKMGKLLEAQSLLEFAADAHGKWIGKRDNNLFGNDEFFQPSLDMVQCEDLTEKLEKLVTNNLQMLSFVFNQQGNFEKFAVYHHLVLRRQLDMREGDAMEWAMKTARLGYFFMTHMKFAQSRHHLAAACYVLSQYESTLKTLKPSEPVLSKWEQLNQYYADIAKCWVKYGLFLYFVSKNNELGEELEGAASDKEDSRASVDEADAEPQLTFPNLCLEGIEHGVTCARIATVDESRKLFLFTHSWLKKSKVFYTVEDHPLEYVNVSLDFSELLRYLALYEEDLENEYSIQKHRMESLEKVMGLVREVKPECYNAAAVELLRELTTVQMEMMSLNLRRLCAVQQDTDDQHTADKIEALGDIHRRIEQFFPSGDALATFRQTFPD